MEKKGVMIPILLAFGALVFYQLVLRSRASALSQAYETAEVVVAKADIAARTALQEDLVTTQPIPRKFMAQDAFEVKTPSDLKLIANLVTRVSIPKGNQVVQSALVSMSPDAGLSVKIPPGYRGAILPIDSDLQKLLKPGDRVDILVTFDAKMQDQSKEKVTATILQNVLVLGVGANLGQGLTAKEFQSKQGNEQNSAAFSEKGFLSLALNPNEAQYLALALKQGETAVVLRGLGDVEMHPMEMASFRKLFR